jgi:hypothetical protein
VSERDTQRKMLYGQQAQLNRTYFQRTIRSNEKAWDFFRRSLLRTSIYSVYLLYWYNSAHTAGAEHARGSTPQGKHNRDLREGIRYILLLTRHRLAARPEVKDTPAPNGVSADIPKDDVGKLERVAVNLLCT